MDAELSLIMANMAKVSSGSLMYDPFCGTGSFPIIASHFGAYSLGADIDGRQIRGKAAVEAGKKPATTQTKCSDVAKTKNEINHEKALSMANKSIMVNAKQYDLERRILDNLVFDFAHHPFRMVGNGWFDAIITDPPYGIIVSLLNFPVGVRAGAKTIGFTGKSIPAECKDSPSRPNIKPYGTCDLTNYSDGKFKYPETVPYAVPDLLRDLLEFAAENLRDGGRLVYWYPHDPREYGGDSDLPTHPRLKMVGNSEQPLRPSWSRRLITMQKLE
jgi:tRNA (guanine10-N2)-methyltransferase